MKPKSEKDTQHAFDSFCKKVLRNEVRNFYKEVRRQRENEVLFSELSAKELEQLGATDDYFVEEGTFSVADCDVIVKNELLAEALRSLPDEKRDIVLLYYFLKMSDKEIGERLDMIRATVQYKRTSTLKQLKEILGGGHDNE